MSSQKRIPYSTSGDAIEIAPTRKSNQSFKHNSKNILEGRQFEYQTLRAAIRAQVRGMNQKYFRTKSCSRRLADLDPLNPKCQRLLSR